MVVFSVVKHYWTVERDRWEREKGEKISKSNFLTVYGAAHLRALKPAVIRSAFRKTSVWPFDPSVVTEDMMAPSKVTSCEGHLPIKPASPVKAVAKLLRDLSNLSLTHNNGGSAEPGPERMDVDSDGDDNINMDPPNISAALPSSSEKAVLQTAAVSETLQRLSTTSLAHLVSGSPLTSASHSQKNSLQATSPTKERYASLLTIKPKTRHENLLLDALRDAQAWEDALK